MVHFNGADALERGQPVDPDDDSKQLRERIRELEKIEEELKNRVVKEALGKFNLFLHLTGYLAGCAYLVLLGVFVPEALPYVFIPIGLWTAALAYHAWRAWHPRAPSDEVLKSLEKRESEERGD
jgi:hypothetical protein